MIERVGTIWLLLAVLVFTSGADKPPLLRRAFIESLPDNAALLTVELSEPGTVRVLYDSERPANIDKLETFWHQLVSTNREAVHVFRIEDLFPERIHYLRLDCRSSRTYVSPLLAWTYSIIETNRIRLFSQ
jgi:hypothetical protein